MVAGIFDQLAEQFTYVTGLDKPTCPTSQPAHLARRIEAGPFRAWYNQPHARAVVQISDHPTFIGRNVASAREAMRDLQDGTSLHGLSDGSWSLSDAIMAILQIVGPSDVAVAYLDDGPRGNISHPLPIAD